MKKTREDIVIDIFGYTFMFVFSVFCLFPFLLMITCSITDEATLQTNGFSLIPQKISFLAYQLIFQEGSVFSAYRVTIIVTIFGTFFDMLMTSSMAYAISVNSFIHRNKIAFFVYITMLFSGGLVPSYLLISKYLHLNDTIWVYILPGLINPFNMFLLRNFFKGIPDSLAESAKIDGANDIYILFRIILPLSKPALATIALFYALGHWNEWFSCLLYIKNKNLITLQYLIMKVLRELDLAKQMSTIQQNVSVSVDYVVPSNSAKLATAVVTVGPIIFVYPFVQKYFVKGLVVGGIKG